MPLTTFVRASSVLALVLLSACGGGGGAGPRVITPSATVTGTASKGLLLNAVVTFYPVSNGAIGSTALATVRTDAITGAFSSAVSSAGAVVAVLTVDGATQMLDEISGDSVTAPAGLMLRAVFPSLTNLQPLAITPLTELAYVLAASRSGGLSSANIDLANSIISSAFLDGAPILQTLPISITQYASGTPAQQAQAKLLTALSVAADQGIATDADGLTCAGGYPANIPCVIAGMSNLVSVTPNGTAMFNAEAGYLSAAYEAISSGTVTLDGGKTPAELGMNVPTPAEAALVENVAAQNPLPGYNPSANPLVNTKDLIANIRTNTITQWNADKFGMPDSVDGLIDDFNTTLKPVVSSTGDFLASAYLSALVLRGESERVTDDLECLHGPEGAALPDVVTCEYGWSSISGYVETPGNSNSSTYRSTSKWIQMTVTRSAATTYSLRTRPFERTYSYTQTCNPDSGECQFDDTSTPEVPIEGLSELSALLSLTKGGDAYAASIEGRYYVTTSGGNVQASLQASQSSNWHDATYTGSLSVSGTLSSGAGGVSLVEARIADSTMIHVRNARTAESILLWQTETHNHTCYDPETQVEYSCSHEERVDNILPTVNPGSPPVAAWGAVELAHFRTERFSYAGRVTVAEPTYDASGIVGIPATVTAKTVISEALPGGAWSPLFQGSISANVLGVAAWDATRPFSNANILTGQAQATGTLTLPSGRVLAVSAIANADRRTSITEDDDDNDISGFTPDHPASFSATYRYVTAAGISELHAEATYDDTNGLRGTITNNAGVVIVVVKPVDSDDEPTAVITANGFETATIDSDGWVHYSDFSSESLF